MDRALILWEDSEMLFVLKEAGIPSQSPGMPELLAEQIGAEIVYPVHRLDKEAAGVMVYAKTKNAAAALSEAIAERRMEKEYLAVVKGAPASSGEMRDLLYHDPRKNKSFVVKKERRGVREAILTYEVLRVREETALVKVRLQTGRTHQIRVQFASRGYPLLGDSRYGGGKGALHLFSRKISVPHPKTGETVCVSAVPAWAED